MLNSLHITISSIPYLRFSVLWSLILLLHSFRGKFKKGDFISGSIGKANSLLTALRSLFLCPFVSPQNRIKRMPTPIFAVLSGILGGKIPHMAGHSFGFVFFLGNKCGLSNPQNLPNQFPTLKTQTPPINLQQRPCLPALRSLQGTPQGRWGLPITNPQSQYNPAHG